MPVIYTKPSLWCLFLHQAAWDYYENKEDVKYCPICQLNFFYPSDKDIEPKYKKFL